MTSKEAGAVERWRPVQERGWKPPQAAETRFASPAPPRFLRCAEPSVWRRTGRGWSAPWCAASRAPVQA